MKVLVTGGNGEVGQTVVRRLARTHQVRVADVSVPAAADRAGDVEWIVSDLTSQQAADDAVAGQDAIVHLAAIPNSFVFPGTEILHPVAVTIFGGLLSATFLDAFVTPVLMSLFGRNAISRLRQSAQAEGAGPVAAAGSAATSGSRTPARMRRSPVLAT